MRFRHIELEWCAPLRRIKAARIAQVAYRHVRYVEDLPHPEKVAEAVYGAVKRL